MKRLPYHKGQRRFCIQPACVLIPVRSHHNNPWIPAMLLVITLLVTSVPMRAYSVLTHEEIVDLTWDEMKAALLQRFPSATADDMKTAHAYAYGGCVIQDMGYYPFGSRPFSDLVHYVRSG